MIQQHCSIIPEAYVQPLSLQRGRQTGSLPLELATGSTPNVKLKGLEIIKPYLVCFLCKILLL
jgi:hypothetical protein